MTKINNLVNTIVGTVGNTQKVWYSNYNRFFHKRNVGIFANCLSIHLEFSSLLDASKFEIRNKGENEDYI